MRSFGAAAAVVIGSLASPPAHASPADTVHVALSAGAGFAYDGVGLRVDLRWRQADVFCSTGPLGFPHTKSDIYGQHEVPVLGSWAAGVRWFFREEASGPWLSGYAMRSEDRLSSAFIAGRPLERSIHAAVTFGWRWAWGGFFLEAGAGPVLHFERQYLASEPGDPKAAAITTNVGLFYDSAQSGSGLWFLPAVDLGLGYEF